MRKLFVLVMTVFALTAVSGCGTNNDNDPVEDNAPLHEDDNQNQNDMKDNDVKHNDMNENDMNDNNNDINPEDDNGINESPMEKDMKDTP